MFGIGAPRTGISLSRPCSLHCHSVLAMRRCLPRASQQTSVRSSRSSTSSSRSSSSSSAASQKGIFDREAELQQLDGLQHTPPHSITVVLGPRNCGKTALLKEVFASQADAVYVDCRAINALNPDSLVQALLSLLAEKVPLDVLESGNTDISKTTITTPDLVRDFLGSEVGRQDISAVYRVLRELLTGLEMRRGADGSRWPVLVIDEANVMMEWTNEHPRELASLLRNLVALSKQDKRCHVILATSESAFQAWLTDKIGPDFWLGLVIGDFPEAVARGFLEHELKQQASSSMLDDHAWYKVFQVCGGNAGALSSLAGLIDSHSGDWDAALEALSTATRLRITALVLGGDGWTAAQYADIMLQLLDAKHHAMPVVQAWMLLGRHTAADTPEIQATEGKAVLERLVKANALSVRPKSAWATDIPAEAFAAEAAVVTAPSSRELYCVGQLRGQLEATLQRWQEAAATKAPAGAPRPPSPGSSPEVKEAQRQIKQVEQQVERVEQQIERVEQEAKEAKQQGDKEEVAVLRSKEQQLRLRKQQLRISLGQLREEKLVLLRIYAGNGS